MSATIFIPGVYNKTMLKMFMNKASADVFFQVGNGSTQIPAHRTVLSEGSEGFKVRLEGNWAGMTDIAEMIAVEENVFRSLLIFIYKGGEIDFETRYLLDVLMLARSFLMQDMVDKIISQEVFDVYASHHVWSFLSFAVIAGDEELQNRCLTLIDSDAPRFLSLDGFQSVGSAVIKLLVGRNTLGISELELFKLLVSWSESNCERQGLQISAEHQRSLMQDFLFDIRYSLMSREDVSQIEATNILTSDEIKIIRTTIRMDPVTIPVPSPSRSPVLPSLMLSNRIASGSSVKKTTASTFDQIQKELEEAMANIDKKEEVIGSLDQELAHKSSIQPVTRVQSQPNDSWYILSLLNASLITLVFVYFKYGEGFPGWGTLIFFVFTVIVHRMALWLVSCYRYRLQ